MGGAEEKLPAAMVIYNKRLLRRHFFPWLFGDPAWDMLLLLGGAGAQTVSGLSIAGGTAPTTGLRWIARLEEAGLIERFSDARDNRRHWVRLSAAGRSALTSYLRRVGDPFEEQLDPEGALIVISRLATLALGTGEIGAQ